MPILAEPCQDVRLVGLPIWGEDQALEVPGVTLNLDDRGKVKIILVEGKDLRSDQEASLVGILLDTRGQNAKAEKLRLDIVIPAGQPISFFVEASEDLKNWRSFGEQVLYRSPDGTSHWQDFISLNGELKGNTLLRVVWRSQMPLISPIKVKSAILSIRQSAKDITKPVLAKVPPLINAHRLEFSLPFRAPIKTISIRSMGQEGLMPVSIFGRIPHEEAWVLLGQGSANTNPVAIPLSGQAASIIKIEVDARTSGFAVQPEIEFGLSSQEIAFAASGARPFTIVAGKQSSTNAFLPLSSLTSIDPSNIPLVKLNDPTSQILALSSADKRGGHNLTILLWVCLLVAIVLLAGVAWQVWRRRNNDDIFISK